MSVDNGQTINKGVQTEQPPHKTRLTRRQFLTGAGIFSGAAALAACSGSTKGGSTQEITKSTPDDETKKDSEGKKGGHEIDDQDYGEEIELLTDTIRDARVVREGRAAIELAPDALIKVDLGVSWLNSGLGSLTRDKKVRINVYKVADGEEIKDTSEINDREQIVIEDIDFTDADQRVTCQLPKGFTLKDTPWRNYFKEIGGKDDSRVEIEIITQEEGKQPEPKNKHDDKIGTNGNNLI